MHAMFWIAAASFVLATGAIVLFASYPLALAALSLFRRGAAPRPPPEPPTVSLLTVVRNAEDLIEDKVRNSLALDYPAESLRCVFYSDGSTDRTEEILRRHEGERVTVLATPVHEGKIAGLNRAMEACSGTIVVLTDADAAIDPQAVRNLVRHFGDPEVGGISGRATIGEARAALGEAQSVYLSLNCRVRLVEARLGSVTSNEGKLFAIRRELYRAIPEGVTDDLFAALSVVAQNRRFGYDPEALAYIRVPSRSPAHEIRRRRRIVAQSLRGIWLYRGLLNPFRFGAFAIGLAINKVLRRLLPFALLLLLAGSLILSARFAWARVATLAQAAFWALAGIQALVGGPRRRGIVSLAASVVFYVAVGQLGTLLGVVDFLRGRRVTRWEPIKSDGRTA